MIVVMQACQQFLAQAAATRAALPITFCTKHVLRRLTRNACPTHYTLIVSFAFSTDTRVQCDCWGARVRPTSKQPQKKNSWSAGNRPALYKNIGRSTMYRRQVQNNETLIRKATNIKQKRQIDRMHSNRYRSFIVMTKLLCRTLRSLRKVKMQCAIATE